MTRIIAIALAVMTGMAGTARAEELNVGDPAPPLVVKEFVKGDAVKGLEKGKIYVVEFWATWCGPCRTSIPHLTELQKKNPNVTFIGVSVWESNPKAVVPFVEKMGDKMDYRVAMDDVGEGTRGSEGAMAKTWMTAAAQQGIPAAFIINGDGKVAWVGHPMQMEKPLEEIKSGKWNLVAATKQFKKDTASTRRIVATNDKLQKATDPKEKLAILELAISDDPKLESMFALRKFQMLQKTEGSTDKPLQYGEHLVDKIFSRNANSLNSLARIIISPTTDTKPDDKRIKLALRASTRADELAKGKNPLIADTLAKAYFEAGDANKAVETQERAVKLAAGTPMEKDASLKNHLEQYKKAVKKE
jgi:thiol-disulfide isomerase/thioredoxin